MINRSAPRATVVPILIYPDVGQAIDWLCFYEEPKLTAQFGGAYGTYQEHVGRWWPRFEAWTPDRGA